MSVERYKCVPEGGNRFDLMEKRPDLTPNCWKKKKTGSTDVFGRMRWDEPAPTIRTEFFKPEKGRYLHPQAHRPITIREAARLQTFPDEFIFAGSNVQVAKQIGNAVPVKLATAIARHVQSLLGRRVKKQKRNIKQTAAAPKPRISDRVRLLDFLMAHPDQIFDNESLRRMLGEGTNRQLDSSASLASRGAVWWLYGSQSP